MIEKLEPGKADFLGTMPMGRLLARIAIPGSVALLVNSAYNLVDTIFVGQGVGPIAIGAVSLLFPFRVIVMSFGNLVGIGAASVVSRSLGAGENAHARAATGTALSSSAFIGLIVGILGASFVTPLVRILGASGELVQPTYEYARIIVLSEPFLIFNFAANYLIRGEGRARFAMVALTSGVLLNIMLDPIFIFVFGWGVGGAALATLFGHMLTTVFSVAYFVRGKGVVRLTPASLRPRLDILRETLAIGFSGLMRQLSSGVLQVIRNNLIVALAGALAVSAFGVVFRTILIMAMPAMGVAQALPPIAGYNFGAENPLRVRQSVRLSIGISSVITWIGMGFMMLFPAPIFRVFTSDPEVIAIGVPFMRVNAIALLVFPTYFIGAAFYQAIGAPRRALVIALLRPAVGLLIMFAAVRTVGTIGIVAADPLAIVVGAFAVIVMLTHSFRTDARLAVRG
ncbi:MAG: MATE family efflux transporter [Spirochaetaceae bacterium]|nr:MAG: MATE family efflux transporter [Spirochaetaceae bacterium]